MEQAQLRQLQNSVEIIGTLKTKELEVKTSRAGNQYMSGKIVVVSKVDNIINETPIKVFIMATSKLFKGIETVNNEYKASDDVGIENADRVRITGELTLNEYYNKQEKLVQFNESKGVFFNRLNAENDQPDRAIASIDTVIESFVEKLDSDQLPTGDYTINGFTVGWGNEVIELKNTIVKAELASSFMSLYQPGQTGRLTFKLNNYVEIEEQTIESIAPVTHGFGSVETVDHDSIIKNYVNNLEIIGGDIPYFGTKEYTPEEIVKAKQVRTLKLQTLNQPAPTTPKVNTGFGEGSSTFSSNEDMPDF